jgi:hypothetical protein
MPRCAKCEEPSSEVTEGAFKKYFIQPFSVVESAAPKSANFTVVCWQIAVSSSPATRDACGAVQIAYTEWPNATTLMDSHVIHLACFCIS